MTKARKIDELAAARIKLNGANLRTESADGIDYLVTPAVMMIVGVRNGELVPAEELAPFVSAWNDTAVVLNHPEDADGLPVGVGDDPDLPKFGRIYNARLEDDSLVGELWLRADKMREAGGEALQALELIEAGQPIELSVGFFRYIDPTPGVFDGRRFYGISRGIVPDHVALLPNDVGACSIADGCGTPVGFAAEGVMIALYPSLAQANEIAVDPADLPDAAEVLAADDLHVTLAYMGTIDTVGMSEGDLLKAVADFASSMPIIYADITGGGYFSGAPGGRVPFFAGIGSDQLRATRFALLDWWLWDQAVGHRFNDTPHMTIAYYDEGTERLDVPVIPSREIIFDTVSVAYGGRVTHFNLQGEASVSAGEEPAIEVLRANLLRLFNSDDPTGSNLSDQDQGVKKTMTEQNDQQQQEEGTQEDAGANTEFNFEQAFADLTEHFADLTAQIGDLSTNQANVGSRLEAIETLTAQQAAERKTKRDGAIAVLIAADQNVLSEATLRNLPDADLFALHAQVAPDAGSDYSARASQQDRDGDEWEEYQPQGVAE